MVATGHCREEHAGAARALQSAGTHWQVLNAAFRTGRDAAKSEGCRLDNRKQDVSRTQVRAHDSNAAMVASLCALELPKGTGPRR